MFMIVPGWDVFAKLSEDDNRNMASFVKLHVSDDDLVVIVRTLVSNGYTEFALQRNKQPGAGAGAALQTVYD